MRFLLSRVCVIATAVALSIGDVSGLTVCYPGCGPNDYTGYSSTLTPWNSKSISLPKFDSEDGGDPNARTLEKVTISTKVFFETEFFVKCTAGANCDTSFTGSATAGVYFGMYPSSSNAASLRTNLPQYWGRWGDYRLSDPNSQYDMTKRASVWDASGNGDPFFVEYTYPFFDIPGFVPETNAEGIPNKVWTHLLPSLTRAINLGSPITTFLFADSSDNTFATDGPNGRVVIHSNSDLESTYSDDSYNPGNTIKVLKAGVGTTTPTPDGTLVSVGKYTFDGTSTPFTKTISLDDFAGTDGGGINNNITPETMLALFTDSTSSGGTIVFDTDADGFVTADFTGGNFETAQTTTGYTLMQIQYQYSGPAITSGDPQFSGFQGQSFQIHGYPGSYFHLISAPQFQMNGRFSYIANGHCNYNHTACWTHPGTYIDDLAIIVDELLVRITAGAVGQGYSVRINDEPFHAHAHGVNETSDHTDIRKFVPTKFYDAATRLTVHLRSPLEIYVRTDLFALTIHNADHFFNIDSQLLVRPILTMGREVSPKYPHPQNGKPWFPQFPIHGFIGQTWAKATYANNKQYQGDVDDYVETRPYATESIYSQYFKKFDEKNMNWDN